MSWLLYPQEGDPVPIVKVGVWVGMVAGLDGSRKSRLRPWFEPWTVQTVASDIPTTLCWNMLVNSKSSLYMLYAQLISST